MTVSMVVAVAENGVIGRDGDMPWRLSTDLKRFKQLTLGKPIIMGRKTFESIGKPLPGRTSIVVTRDRAWQSPGVVVANSLDQAVEVAREIAEASDSDEICVIGGGEIYRQAFDLADCLHVTRVHGNPEGDTHFPQIDPDHWSLIREEAVPAGEKDTLPTSYQVFQRLRDAA